VRYTKGRNPLSMDAAWGPSPCHKFLFNAHNFAVLHRNIQAMPMSLQRHDLLQAKRFAQVFWRLMGLPSHEASHATKETNLTWKKAGIHDATVNAHDLEYISRFCVKGETVKVVTHNECTFEKTDKRDGMLVFNRA